MASKDPRDERRAQCLGPLSADDLGRPAELLPRLVARGNYSWIGIARVLFNGAVEPFGAERLRVVLGRETYYESDLAVAVAARTPILRLLSRFGALLIYAPPGRPGPAAVRPVHAHQALGGVAAATTPSALPPHRRVARDVPTKWRNLVAGLFRITE
jgi:hypothetical protein